MFESSFFEFFFLDEIDNVLFNVFLFDILLLLFSISLSSGLFISSFFFLFSSFELITIL